MNLDMYIIVCSLAYLVCAGIWVGGVEFSDNTREICVKWWVVSSDIAFHDDVMIGNLVTVVWSMTTRYWT